MLVGVPAASAISSLLSLRRVRISPLGVSRRVTPPAPTLWRIVPLLVGIVLFIVGLARTTAQSIGAAAFPGLIVILIGLVVGGPWLTAQAARLFGRFMTGASSLLAARRLADNPKAAFRSVSGLVLAVFLGTVVAGLLPAVESITATPSATALSNVLLDGFTSAPVCGNNVNCSGRFWSWRWPAQPGLTARQRRIAAEGLPPREAAALLSGLTGVPRRHCDPHLLAAAGREHRAKQRARRARRASGGNAVISCAGLRELAVLGQCAPGRTAVVVPAVQPVRRQPDVQHPADRHARRARPRRPTVSGLYLQAVLVKVNSAATLERVRTYLVTHTAQSASGTAPRTFGEAVQARQGVAATVQRLVYIAVALTLVVAGCSLAVAVGGSLVERKRPFTLLRLTGTPTSTLYRVVFLEAVLPLVAATVVAAGTAYGISVLTVGKMAPAGTPVPVPGHAYFLTMGSGPGRLAAGHPRLAAAPWPHHRTGHRALRVSPALPVTRRPAARS